MKLIFSKEAWEDYQYWVNNDNKKLLRINEIIIQCQRTPYIGIRKPEALKGDLSGWWSRRITQEHKIIYRIVRDKQSQNLEITQIRFSY